ncbi:ABC transporter permease [Martelella sp. HB161492]|uniref:ABC transporter permease n=1 Tax=Martelella sp. HB161492 TaxID=2720726 RepID=UPI0015915925|nr:ABC transporter permease [Martelella sp. HB161492]
MSDETMNATAVSPSFGKRLVDLYRNLGPRIFATALLSVIVIVVIAAPLFAPHDPIVQNLMLSRRPPAWLGGSWDYPLGTDAFGRDLLSRLIYGGRISLFVALIAATISMVIGTLLGLLAGWFEGRTGAFILGLADVKFSLPFYVVAVSMAATIGPGMQNLIILLAIWGWPNYARTVAVVSAQTRRLDYIAASRMQGAGTARLILTHILPRCLSVVVIIWSGMVGSYILVESALSFIGLGVQVPTFSWGSMLSSAQSELRRAWWIAIFPGAVLTTVIVCVFLTGDLLRDHLDPSAKR